MKYTYSGQQEMFYYTTSKKVKVGAHLIQIDFLFIKYEGARGSY